MTPAELRALPIVIHERRHHRHLSDPAFNDLLVIPASSCSASTHVCTVPGMVARDTQGLRSIPAIVIHVRRHHRPHSAPSMISWYLLHQAALPAHMGIQSTILDCQRLTGLRSISPAQDMDEVVPSSGSSTSNCSSPRGPKGGGTLKTCAVCIEDYRRGCHAHRRSHLHHSVMCLPFAMSTG